MKEIVICILKKTYLTKDKIDEKYFNDDNYEEVVEPELEKINNEETVEEFSNLKNIEDFKYKL